MRFLFGVILGAVLTLIVATTFNVPTHALLDKAKTSWDRFLLSTGNALFELPSSPVAVPEIGIGDQSFSSWAIETDEAVRPPSLEPRVTLDLDIPLASAEAPIDLEPPVAESAIALPSSQIMNRDSATQTVWVPFRSQMSAQGFAKRLTGKLDHPFSVNREGPGRYQVIFSYANEFERLALLDKMQSVTGQDSQ